MSRLGVGNHGRGVGVGVGVRGFGGGERVDVWISITEKLQLTPPLPHDGGGGGERGMRMKQVNEKMWELG